MKKLVIYHGNCIDGYTAAWAASLTKEWEEAEFLPASYGDAPPNVADREVLILDFSYPRAELLQMITVARQIQLLDHHKTAQADLSGLAWVTFDMERSGAGLAWDVLHPGIERPWLINYVEDRDLWRFSLPQSKQINARISAVKRASFLVWSALHCEEMDTVILKGTACLEFVDRYVEEMKAQARMIDFYGYKVPFVNAPYINISELLNELAKGQPFAVGWSQRGDGLYAYSLRSDEQGVDVSVLAKKFGGGGHKHSAGFVMNEVISQFARVP